MTDWIVRRWARFGHERLYVGLSDGTSIGYLDLKTGQLHADDPANLCLLELAVAEHIDTPSAPPTSPAVDQSAGPLAIEPAPEPTLPVAASDDWIDLSMTQAGAAARERAVEEREAQGGLRHALARLTGAKTDERAWRIGADGEEAVAHQLAKLGVQWHALHAVRVGKNGADIDHVVIGPAGVFTINAKHHPRTSVWVGGDTFMVNGQRVPYIRNSRHEARRAAKLLTRQAGFSVEVTGVIAVMGAHDGFKVKKQPEDGAVVVVQRKRISQYLRRLPQVLHPDDVETIFEVARRSTTWQ